MTISKLEINLKGNVLVPPKFLGLSALSHMGEDRPIAMVLLIFICLFGIDTTTTKGTSFTKESLSNFLQIDSNNYHQLCYGISLNKQAK